MPLLPSKFIKIMQSSSSDQLVFHKETNTFSLTVTLKDNQLTISLKDFIDWIIYQKRYTESDIGKEIHQKLDLVDVYSAFQLNKSISDEQANQKQETNECDVEKYQFGKIVEVGGIPCYRIQNGGKLTVYTVLVQKRANKQMVYESELELSKVKIMTKDEIAQVKKACLSKEQLQKKIYKLEQNNENLFYALRKAEEQSQKKSEIIRNLEQTLSKQISRKNNLAMKEKIHLFSLPQFYSSYFSVNGLQLKYNRSNKNTHYIFNHPIYQNESTKFKLKIIRSEKRYIMIGVVDYIKQKDERSSIDTKYSMCYYGAEGKIFPQDQVEGFGFEEGDVVEVAVDRAKGSVEYSINGTLRASHMNAILVDGSRIFMPFVEMHNTQDTVEWLLSEEE